MDVDSEKDVLLIRGDTFVPPTDPAVQNQRVLPTE
jgi:hypothetical protein